MVQTCIAAGCPVNIKTKSPTQHLHKFPAQPELLKQWLAFCGQTSAKSHWRICSTHFIPSDYEKSRHGVLYFDAVPTIVYGTFEYFMYSEIHNFHNSTTLILSTEPPAPTTKIYNVSIRQNIQNGMVKIPLPDNSVLHLK